VELRVVARQRYPPLQRARHREPLRVAATDAWLSTGSEPARRAMRAWIAVGPDQWPRRLNPPANHDRRGGAAIPNAEATRLGNHANACAFAIP
jgi:hypothetical protein